VTTYNAAATVADPSRVFTRLEVDHCLEVLDDRATTFRTSHVHTIRAEMPSRFFVRRYTWTGTDDNDTAEVICEHDVWGHPRHRLHGPIIREGSTRIVLIDLGRTLSAGEIETVHIAHQLRDLAQTFTPMLGHTVKPGNERITLRVILPERQAERVTYRERMVDTDHDVHAEPLVGVPCNHDRLLFSKVISDPAQHNRRYRICWGYLG
jgi:hypothetical protein